uniref:Uncharacterized protein n=1 Tax=Lygus hesperus TaxID=30085 RepID=A0A0K8SUZ4_LYGHE
MCELLAPLAVSAMLEHEATMGIPRTRSSSVASQLPSKKRSHGSTPHSSFHFNRILNLRGVDYQMVGLFFMQLFYCLCACALNNVMLTVMAHDSHDEKSIRTIHADNANEVEGVAAKQ